MKSIKETMGRLKPKGPGLAFAERTIMLAPLVGVIAGLGAILFHLMCVVVTHYVLSGVVGYAQGGPLNEAGFTDFFPRAIALQGPRLIPWLIVLVPTIGGLISGTIVYLFAPEAEGHGTDAAIDAYHNKRGVIRARVPLVKMITAAITLGTGGSGGREGPIAQIGAGFGSFLASRFKLSDNEHRVLMAAGMGAGIGAIFHAPLAGAIFAIEVLYRDPDFEAEALIPAFIATAVSYCTLSIAVFFITQHYAFDPLFQTPADLKFDNPLLLLPLVVLAMAMSLASLAYTKCFYVIRNAFQKMKVPKLIKPAIGAFATGLLALISYHALFATAGPSAARDSLSVLSFGYGFLQKVIGSEGPLLISVLMVVGLGKIVTTSMTIGSGGSGGVFGPSMVIGGSLGAVVGLVFHLWLLPHIVARDDVVVFAILGMASFFAAAANTPVSTLIMVSELTASYQLLLPSMWVCALAYMLNRGWTIYSEQVKTRLESPAHRGDFIIDVLEGMTVQQALSAVHRPFTSVPPSMPLKDMVQLITDTEQACFPVVDDNGCYLGLFGLNDIRQLLYDSDLADLAVAEDLATNEEPLTITTDLSSAIGRFGKSQYEELPVVDDAAPDRVLALLRRQDVIATYNSQLLTMRQQ